MIILDDVLPKPLFARLSLMVIDNDNFSFVVGPTADGTDSVRSFAASPSPGWEFEYFSLPLLNALGKLQNIRLTDIFRIRFGLLFRDINQIVNTPHVDNDKQPHHVGLYYLNDTDGATKIWKQKHKDWGSAYVRYSLDECELLQEVEPKSNRMVIFDGSHYHSSVTPTKTQLRYVINYDFEIVEK